MTIPERRAAVLAGLGRKAQYGFAQVPIEVMLAQSDLESATWTSDLCIEANNAFGMTYPLQRETTSIRGEWVIAEGGKKFAKYRSLEDSAEDYLMRQRYFHIHDTPTALDYMQETVESNYGSGANYMVAWASRIVGLDEELTEAEASEEGGSGALLLLGGLLLLAS